MGTIAGQSIRLSNDNGGSGDGYSNCVFRDDAASNVTTQSGNVTITGNYIPEELLSTLSGDPNGNWTLRVTDDAGQDVGTLTSWTLEIVYPNGLSYAWTSTPPGFTSSLQNPTGVTVNEATNYQVVLTDIVTGCTSSSLVAVSVIENPSPKVIPGDTVLCNGTDFYIQVIDTGAYSGGYPVGTLLDWVNIISNQNYYDSLNVIGNGSSFQAKITLPSGCFGFSPVRTILSKAVVSNEVIKHASCNLNNGKIISTMVLGTAPFRYVWKNGLTIIRDTISYSAIDSIYDLATGNYSLDITDNYGNIVPSEPSCTGGPFSYVVNNIPPPAVTLAITNISCFGMADGSITATPNQGSAPYTYLWSNNATTEINSYLSAGTYSVTVTDNDGCTAEAQGSIIEPGVLNINLTNAEPLCTGASNGIVASSIGGGTPPFVFDWFDNLFQPIGTNDDSLFNVPAGTYHLAVTDANFCNTSSTIVVDDPPLLTAVCNPSDATCFGASDGSATINASGGRGTYSYLWSTGATTTSVSSLPAGSYLVTVTDGNGCTAQCTAIIGEPTQVGGNVSGNDVACIDGQTSVIVTGTGGTAPYTGEGSFTVGVGTHNFPIVDLNGCTGTASITINHLDVDAPVISNCPIDITQCESIVTWVAPSASDNCTLTSFVSNFNSGDAFPVGTTLVTYTATDNAGLVSTCNFNITILPTPVWYQDLDTDGFGNALVSITSCNQPVGYIADNTDCDDTQLFYADLDGDTYGAGAPVACGVASNTDCNDGNAAINPSAAEVCNGIDDNCNGLTDDGLVFVTYYADADGDGFGNLAVSVSTCDGAPVGYVIDNTDCDDAQLLYADLDGDTYGAGAPVACGVASNNDCNDAVAAINPGAAEVCNLIDDDCDGNTDEGVQLTFYADADMDSYGDPLTTVLACTAPVGYVADNTDCDDTNPAVNPAAIEVCNLIDDDCDGSIDEGVQSPFYADTDSDSYGDPLASVMACTAPLGYVADNTDCNDGNAAINPGAAEVCNGIDDNCNGLTDDGLVFVTYYADADGDGFGNLAVSVSTCDGAPVGYVIDNTDCDDAQLLYADLDGDTYGAGAPVACGVASNNDCNDAVAAINPGAAEVCNLIDDDCDGNTDEGVQLTFYADADMDSYGDPLATVLACTAPVGYVADNTDCDDTNPAVNPAAIEVCNLIDDDCDGSIDEGVQSPFYADTDSDSYGDPLASVMACTAPLGYVADNTDCNDGNAAINPGAAEVCNGIDDNCNGLTDDGLVFVTYYADADGDGFGNLAVSVSTCDGAPVGYVVDNTDCDDAQLLYADLDGDTYGAGAPVACGVASNTDCNDGNAAINPGAAEVCNGIDDNCNGLTDDGLVFVTYYADADGDGFGNLAVSVSTCDGAPVGYVVDNTDCDDAQLLYADLDGDTYGAGAPVACGVASNTDCNDGNAAINPGAAEVCNGIDDNCNGLTDDGLVFITYYADVDGDGFGNAASSVSTCDGAPAGYVVDNTDCDDAQLLYADVDGDTYGAGAPVACGVASNTDCNDNDLIINPAATEICGNFTDEDCDGFLNNGCTPYTFYADNDNDTYGDPLNSTVIFINSAPIGYVADNTDCDDNNVAVNPAATEICNLIDDDCDGLTDEGVQSPFYADTDSDTYGDPLVSVMACTAPLGYVADNTDCNDGVATINPGAAEVCNGIDDNCNGLTDDGLAFLNYYVDGDNDGYGAGAATSSCAPIAGSVLVDGDCDDNAAAVNPAATEVCNSIDDDCDGSIDEGVLLTFYADADGDSYGNAAVSVQACIAPLGYVADATDCDDNAATVNPAATEVCNNIDDNCNGLTDDGLVFLNYYVDGDNDGYGAGAATSSCAPIAGSVLVDGDCDDNAAAVNPAATEVCNSIDDDCDGSIDEGVLLTFYADADGDSYGNAAVSVQACVAPLGYVADATDCDDNTATVNPAATEVCNNIDDNCNGLTDDGLVFLNYYVDGDNDGYGAGAATSSCAPIAGSVLVDGDCDDNTAAVNPAATEVCNNIDDNCNGLTDDGLVFLNYYVDGDNDGYGAGAATSSCAPIAGSVLVDGDCDDNAAAVNPAATEVCNSIDDDCDGSIDEGVLLTFYADADGDSYGNAAVSVQACVAPLGYVADATDCDDNTATVNPCRY
ncbi:MAG: HYR domain-containing protein [Bacteroidetes bacterium]|nr:HYR domain-containing protein [Bacteroidota bacterium]